MVDDADEPIKTGFAVTMGIGNDDPISRLKDAGRYQDGGPSGSAQVIGHLPLSSKATFQLSVNGGVYTSHYDMQDQRSLTEERTSVAQIDYAAAFTEKDDTGHRWAGLRVSQTESGPYGFAQDIQSAIHGSVLGGRPVEHIYTQPDAVDQWDVGVEYAQRSYVTNAQWKGFKPYAEGAVSLGTNEQAVMGGLGVSFGNTDLPSEVHFANPERDTLSVIRPSAEAKPGDILLNAGVQLSANNGLATVFGADEKPLNYSVYAEAVAAITDKASFTLQAEYGTNVIDGHGLPEESTRLSGKMSIAF